jgi:hypothetical protein
MTGAREVVALATVVEPWLALAIATAVVVVGADALLADRGDRAGTSLDAAIAPRTERWLLVAIVVAAALVRVVGWQSALTPAWWFSEVAVLPIDKILHDGTFWETWHRQLLATHVDVAYEATAVLPVLAGLQRLLGPRFGLSVLAGAIMGTLAVVLAWALGRRMRSQAFGLALAAMVAFSPLQLVWSRLSAMCTESIVHLLLAMLVGYLAGRRGSLLLAAVTGLVAWTSFQQYYAARVCVPLAAVAMVAGAQRSMRFGRGLVLVLVAGLTFGLVHRAIHHVAFASTFWPSYQGYVGNKGERSLVELVRQNSDAVVHETQTSLTRYFTARRTGWASTIERLGPTNGGLCLLPTALLGVVGLGVVLRRFRTQWPWLAVAALGLALPALSATTARRLLVFDLAWCAFAAHGLLAVVDGLGRRFSYATRGRAAIVVMMLLGAWSAMAVLATNAATAAGFGEHIPFGDAGFGDVISCRRCLDAARDWQRDIADGDFVVLFDNDSVSENRTSPGGLAAYGKIAALAAGVGDRFVEMYGLMANFDIEPPIVGRMFEGTQSFAEELRARVERTKPARIVWHFEHPTTWERWLADRLRDVGGTVETFPTPLAPHDGIRVVTPWDRRDAALAIVDDLAIGLGGKPTPACFHLEGRNTSTGSGPVFLLATDDAGLTAPPEWVIGSWSEHRYGQFRFTTGSPAMGARLLTVPNAFRRVWILGTHGELTAVDLPSMHVQPVPAVFPGIHAGLNCGAWAGGQWWAIEPSTGRVISTHPAAAAVPSGSWIGIAGGRPGELVLASAEQEVLIYDLAAQRAIARFPARVSPSVRDAVDECTPIAVGDDWIGIPSLRTSVLSVYDRSGRDLGATRLDFLVPGQRGLTTIGGAGHYVGVSSGTTVHTFELHVDPACAAGTTAAR